jgi:hypothetical protein
VPHLRDCFRRENSSQASLLTDVPRGAAPGAGPAGAVKRLTIDVSLDLHRRIKSQCAADGVQMADAVREMLETRF